MTDDERAIRTLITTWQDATASGDTDSVLQLMTDDVVFLTPGRPPIIGKQAFAELSRSGPAPASITFESTISEIAVYGDHAHSWTQLTVTILPVAGATPVQRSGNTLTLFKRQPDGSWLLARDANMLAPVGNAPTT